MKFDVSKYVTSERRECDLVIESPGRRLDSLLCLALPTNTAYRGRKQMVTSSQSGTSSRLYLTPCQLHPSRTHSDKLSVAASS